MLSDRKPALVVLHHRDVQGQEIIDRAAITAAAGLVHRIWRTKISFDNDSIVFSLLEVAAIEPVFNIS